MPLFIAEPLETAGESGPSRARVPWSLQDAASSSSEPPHLGSSSLRPSLLRRSLLRSSAATVTFSKVPFPPLNTVTRSVSIAPSARLRSTVTTIFMEVPASRRSCASIVMSPTRVDTPMGYSLTTTFPLATASASVS